MPLSAHIIGLDFDGVIIDHTASKIKAGAALGISLAAHDTPSDILKQKLDPETLKKLQHIIYDDPAYALSAPFVKGALEGLTALAASRKPYYLISRQQDPSIAVESIKAHGLWGNYFTERNIFFVKESVGKEERAAALGIDVYLDDQPSVLRELSVAHKFLLDPLRAYPKSPSYRTVASWPEFLGFFGI